jgi:hypothetical protein
VWVLLVELVYQGLDSLLLQVLKEFLGVFFSRVARLFNLVFLLTSKLL